MTKRDFTGGWNLASGYALFVMTVIYTLNYVDRQILSLVLPNIKSEMHLSDTSLGLISGFVFVLFYSVLGIPIARLADRSNRRNILGIGLFFWSVMTALTGFVGNVWQLVATRFLMGAGEASGIAPTTAIVSDIFDKARRPLALAVVASGSSFSFLIFPLIGWLTQHHGWRFPFMVSGFFGLGMALLLFLTVPEPSRTALSRGAKIGRESFSDTLKFLASSRAYVLTVAGALFVGIQLYAGQVWNPSFLARVHHLNPTEVGAALGLFRGVAGVIGVYLGGALAQWLGARDERWRLWVPGIACALTFPSLLLFSLSPSLGLSLVGLGLGSLFVNMHFGPVYAACQTLARPGMRATSTAIFLFGANVVGQIIGPLAIGLLNDHWAAAYGAEAIRYSLILGAVSGGLGGVLIAAGAGRLPQDTLRAET